MLLAGCGNGGTYSPPPVPTPTPGSDRPNVSGAVATLNGTLTDTVTNNLIASPAPSNTAAPVPVTTTTTYTVADTVTTSASGGNTVFTSNETDTGTLSTMSNTTAATVAYTASGSATDVRTLSTVETDSNGVKYQTTYGANNGLVDVIPETAGTYSWNNAQESYLEYDPGVPSIVNGAQSNVSIDREVNADGSYTQTNGALLSPNNTVVDDIAVENSDFSGTLTLNAVSGGRLYTFSPPSGGTITYTYYNGATKGTSSTTVPDWFPGATKPSVETDSITAGQAFDASCSVPSSYGVTGNKVQQQITTVDSILGTLETKTLTSYDIPGAGTVCGVTSDSIAVFYDYSAQEGPAPRLFPSGSATVPVEQITVTESLSLQKLTLPSASAHTTALEKAGFVLPRSLVLSHVQHLAHQEAVKRLAALHISGGSAK
jgi:hypothetical protein